MEYKRGSLSNEELIHLYESILWPRMIEEKMLVLLRQGKISKWFSGIGQEAIAVGATLAMDPTEWIMPLHRNLGVFTSRKMPLTDLFKQWQGDRSSYSKARERSFHFGSKAHHVCGMISHLGPQLAIADGVALAYQQRGQLKASMAFTGDGGTSEGDFHEALNVAAVWNLPVIFIIENNGYGLSTPTNEQYKCDHLVDRAKGYGMEGIRIDGNNILEVYDTIKGIRNYCIENQKPYLIECMTFRMRGHEEASGVKYVPTALFEIWGKKDPLMNYENFLLEQHILTSSIVEGIREEFKQYIEQSLERGFAEPPVVPVTEDEVRDVYAPYVSSTTPGFDAFPKKEMKLINAITEGLDEGMKHHSNLVLMGQDIAEYGGAFKVSKGLSTKFKERVIGTSISEGLIAGVANGLALNGFKPYAEFMFGDFTALAFDQFINHAAKIYNMYNKKITCPVVFRTPMGGKRGYGPTHSQSLEKHFIGMDMFEIIALNKYLNIKWLNLIGLNSLFSLFNFVNLIKF